MKKITLSILFAVLLLGLFACSNQDGQGNEQNVVTSKEKGKKGIKKGDVREIVWDQLSKEQKDWIVGTWKDGKVSKITLNGNMMNQVDDKSYKGKEVFLIDFPTKSKSIPNNMIVYADIDTFVYIGNGLVD
jgi:alpha-acetolactate decarboxylase